MDRSVFVPLLLSGLFWSSSALSRQYHYIKTRMSWSEAQSYCRAGFTDLATVDTMDDVKRLINTVDVGYSGSVWIGLKRGTQKRWGWSNGEDTRSQYYNWASGQPNQGDCVPTVSGVWYSMACDYKRYFVCYKENSGYTFIRSAKNWSDAQSYCRHYYTDLPTIHNSVENSQIANIISPGWYIWIGMFQDTWEWSDNWSRFFRYWAAGQPSGSGDCAGMSTTSSGKWAQYSCDLLLPFICHGDAKLIRNQIVRLKLSCNGKCTSNDPSLQTAILNEMSEKLESLGLKSDSKMTWRKSDGDKVFHQEINRTTKLNNKCN